jgi:hypothetical protein
VVRPGIVEHDRSKSGGSISGEQCPLSLSQPRLFSYTGAAVAVGILGVADALAARSAYQHNSYCYPGYVQQGYAPGYYQRGYDGYARGPGSFPTKHARPRAVTAGFSGRSRPNPQVLSCARSGFC